MCEFSSKSLIFFPQNERTVHFGPSVVVRALLNTDLQSVKCDIVELSEDYQNLHKSIAFQKDSEFIPLFNFYIKQFSEEGQVGGNLTFNPKSSF